MPSSGRAQVASTISDIQVEGTKTLDPQRVAALSGLSTGTAATPRALQEAIRSLWKAGLFNDIAIDTRPGPPGAGVVAVIRISEAPVVTSVDFHGLHKIKKKDVQEKMPLKPGDRLLEAKLRQAELDLEELYRTKGYYLARIDVKADDPYADSTGVDVDVSEGHKVAVQSIQFSGNRAFSGKRLEKALETDTEGFWFWQNGEFDEEKWRSDLAQRLPGFYGEHGYLEMRVVDDSLAVDPDRGKMRLFVTVDEGRQYRVGQIEIEGNNRFSKSDLRGLLRLAPGDVFDTKALDKTQADLLNLYADDGYIYAQVQPVREPRPDTTVVDLTWQIREGNPAHIEHVVIKGNTVTHESVIRRQLFVVPGQIFRRTDVRNSLLALEGLGFFEPGILPTTKVVDQKTGDIDLTFEVKERRTGSLTLGAAVGGGTGLSGFLGYEQPNLFGQGKSGSIRWEFGSRNNNLELGYTEPVLLGTKTSASVSFFDIDRRFINTSFKQQALGGSVRFGTPLPWDDATRFFYGYKWQRIDLEASDQDNTRFRGQYPRTESSLNLGLVRDTRLPRNHPIQGASHSLNVDLAGGPIGGTTGYQKYEVESSWFAPTYNDRTVLNLKIKAGGINTTRFVPLTEQFLLGGVQFPAEGLRGYRENCVGTMTAGAPLPGVSCGDDRGNAFLLLTAEHFFKISDTVYVSAFYDAGNVWNSFRDVKFVDLKRWEGVGVSIDLPGFGPLGLDYGYGFDRTDSAGNPDPKWQLHFRFGNLGR